MSTNLEHRSAKTKVDKSKDFVFQALGWHAQDVDYAEIDNEEDPSLDYNKYVIKAFGSTLDDKTVSVTIHDYTPSFYVRISESWTPKEVEFFREFLYTKLPYRMSNAIMSLKIVKRKDFWGFTNFKKFKFVEIAVRNIRAMRILARVLSEDCLIRQISQKPQKFKVYESNIDPYIKFMHIQDIEPCGWILLPAGQYKTSTEVLTSKCNVELEVAWNKVQKFNSDENAPFVVASFDIECSGLNGDFPQPVKDYRKLSSDLYDLYTNGLKSSEFDEYKQKEAILGSIMWALGIDDAETCRWSEWVRKVEPKYAFKAQRVSSELKKYIDDLYIILSGKNIQQPSREKIVGLLNKKLSDEKLGLPELKGDPIIQVGTTYHKFGGKDCCFRHILTLGTCDPIEGAVVEACETEQELLLKWRDLINKTNPDIMTGYNIFGFDMVYMYERSKDLGIDSEFMKLGRFQDVVSNFKEAKLSSSALGDNILKYVDMEGRVLIDIMKVVQRDHKLDSYKLDNVANHFMGMNKHDVSPQDIIRLQKGSSADRKIIADYCLQDCALCNHLMMKLELLANNMGMASVCLVPLSYIFMRGQGIKIFSLVLKQCREDGFVIPVVKAANTNNNNIKFPQKPALFPSASPAEETTEEDSYEGAIVLEPKEGIYIDEPVSVLDYASLYPSSMISENLSHDCIVIDKQYDNLPGVEYLDITYDIYEGTGDKKVKSGERVCRFVQLPNGEKGIIPRILMKLLKARKTTRKKMEMSLVTTKDGAEYKGFWNDEKRVVTTLDGESTTLSKEDVVSVEDLYNEFQKAVLDGLQLAYKVTANSLYGQIGAKTSPIYLKDIAACTTATGRKMIMMAKEFLETNYGANIVYGDSVTSYTPVTLRVDGKICITAIENVAKDYGQNMWIPCVEVGKQDKEACELQNVEVWTDAGWTRLHRVIRHALAPHKKIIRVVTHTGVIDVTDDHSLLDANGLALTPKDVIVGTKLLHRDLPIQAAESDVTIEQAAAIGVLMCSRDEGPVRIVPSCILNGSVQIKRAFWDATGAHEEFSTCSMVSAASMYMLAVSLGYKVRLGTQNGVFKVICKTDQPSEDGEEMDTVGSIHEIDYTGYVYDLTTENHHFAAGIGRLVVHNTDSIFAIFPNTPHEAEIELSHDQVVALKGHRKIMPSINTAVAASKEFKKLIKHPHDLEYEKTFWPFILLSKKRYVGNLYEMNDKKFKQKSMGIVLKRRDNAPIVKQVYGGIIDIILNKQDVAASVEFLKNTLKDLTDGKCPLDQLIITKSLKAEYKDPTRIAHKVLAERMGLRDPGNKPQVNDRIPFVYICPERQQGKAVKVLQGDRIEHPDFIRKNKNLKPDYGFYITNQIMKPVLQVYGIVADEIHGNKHNKEYYESMKKKYLLEYKGDEKKAKDKVAQIREDDVQTVLFDPTLNHLDNIKKGNREITDWFKPTKI